MKYFTKQQVADAIKNRPYSMSENQVVQELLNGGATLEGFNDTPQNTSTNAPKKEKGFFQNLNEVAQSPINYLTGVAEQGIGTVTKGIGSLTGSETLQSLGSTLQNQTSDEQQRKNLENTGKAVKVILPVAAGIATAGASIPVMLGASAVAGAAGSVAKDSTDMVDQTGGQIAKNALTSGTVDAGIDAVTLGLGKVLKPLASGFKSRALSNVSAALKPTTNANKEITAKIAGEILDRPLMDTFGATAESIAKKAGATKEIVGEGFNDVVVQGVTKTSEVLQALAEQKSKYMAGGVIVNTDAVKSIDDIAKIFTQYGDNIDNSVLQNVKKILDAQVAGRNGFNTTLQEGSKVDITKFAADRIRGILADSNPDLAKLNKEFTFWKRLEDVATATAKRSTGQTDGFVSNLAGVTTAAATVDGGISSMILKALSMKWAVKAFSSPGAKLITAKAQSKLADSLAQDFAKSNFVNVLKTIAKVFPDLALKIDDEAYKNETEDNRITNNLVNEGELPESEREIYNQL